MPAPPYCDVIFPVVAPQGRGRVRLGLNDFDFSNKGLLIRLM